MSQQTTMGLALPKLTPAVKVLLIANTAVFLLLGITVKLSPASGAWLAENLALSVAGLLAFKIWTLFTYAFVHSLMDVFHLLFNALLLFLFGPVLERRWGTRRFLVFYAIGAIAGGLVFVLSSIAFGSNAQLVGASAAVLAMIIAWGFLFPNLPVYFLGVLPLKGKHLILITVAIEILLAVSQTPISSAAHFGGMFAGMLLVTGYWRPRKLVELVRARTGRPKKRTQKFTVVINPDDDDKAPPGGWVH